MHALRTKIEGFCEGARLWLARYADSSATTDDFQAVMEEASGEQLHTFFDTWMMRGPVRPMEIPWR